ncbi:DnaJ domain-containing protein [Halobellus sp. MBLA0160]|uniref:DnaJ domain-containing protein n=2 Tax=Halobellus ruber TaxID=2761102 RepID=A0A7J9SLJ5_9EURY|nr:DnaJ domain-containing protein [Halobellus ruber]
MENFYELLGVSEDASTDEIDRAWRERVRRYHPDVNDDARATAQFKTLQTAHEVLTDGTERAAYDRLGHETYVEERLDGLPTAGDAPATERDGSNDGGTSGGTGATGGGRTGATGRTTGSGRTGESRSRSRGSGRAGQSAGPNRRERAADAGTGRDRGGGTSARSETSTTRERRRPRRPLAYGWATVAAVSAVYLVGLWSYLGANASALATLAEAPPATIPASLARAGDLIAPGTFVLDAVAAGAVLPLTLAAGAIGLAVGFLAVVASFGRGAAYLYAAGGVAPAAALAVGPVVAAPDGAVLLLAVVIPVATAGLFLVDVGRELLAGP